MKDVIDIENNISFEDSLQLFREFSVKSRDYSYLPPKEANDRDFGSDFPGSLIEKPRYTDCRFYNSQFKASNAAFSIFKNTYFYDCFFEDSNFNYSDFENCMFEKKKDFSIFGTGFNFSQFCNCTFKGINIKGVAFRDINLQNCYFTNCTINNSSFERATIKNCKFERMDLRNIGIRYCRFVNVKFDNIVFPILDLTNNIGLFSILEECSDNMRFSLGYKKEVTLTEAKTLLLSLIPYFEGTEQYFQILNIFLLNGDIKKIISLLPMALEASIRKSDFDALQNICQFIADSNLFSKNQMANFYNSIYSLIDPAKLSFNMQKGYAVYIDNIRKMLIENPYNYPCARIHLVTEINIETLDAVPLVLSDIENLIAKVNSEISPIIQLTHHSPYEFLILLYGLLPDLLLICQTFYYAFGGVKSFSDIKNSKHEKTTSKSDGKDDIIVQEKTTDFEFSLGPIHLRKETKKVVKKMEYTIN